MIMETEKKKKKYSLKYSEILEKPSTGVRDPLRKSVKIPHLNKTMPENRPLKLADR